MNLRSPATSVRRLTYTAAVSAISVLGTLVAGLAFPTTAQAGDSAAERADLAVIIRELHLVDRLARQAQAEAPEHGRYHFDYPAFRADIARVRAGVQGYLTPSRAQPRDPMVLSGAYRQENPSP